MENKRGWVMDQLMLIGELEASMNHNDEQICNLYEELDQNATDPDKITNISNQLSTNYDLIAIDYKNRVHALSQIFDTMPNSDRHYWCQLKHRATAYVMAAENFHARDCDPQAEQCMVEAGKALALTCSLAFGFEPMSCLRCLSEKISAGTESNGYTIATISNDSKEAIKK